MARATFASEAALAAEISRWLGGYGWEVYQEVQVERRGAVADLVAVRRTVLWVIECKRSLSLKLLEQAMAWRGRAHYVSLATTAPSRRPSAHTATAELCRLAGLGWLEATPPRGRSGVLVGERVKAAICRQAAVGALREALDEPQKSNAEAGNAQSKRWTPFQKTAEQLRTMTASEPGLLLSEAVERCEHHYASNQAARATLAKWIRDGIVSGVHLRKVDGRLRLYPDVGWEI